MISKTLLFLCSAAFVFSPSLIFHFRHQADSLVSWETTYRNDLSTQASNPSHTGTNWFDDALASDKICDYLDTVPLLDRVRTSFLDLGMGNGAMLFSLQDEGWGGTMVGVDYSTASVELARRVNEAREKGKEESSKEELNTRECYRQPIQFERWDIMKDNAGDWLPSEGFDVVMDKGTFDAISLSAEIDGHGKRICEGYAAMVERLVKRDGLVVVTSCNWTEEELRRWFESGNLRFYGRVKYPTFRFGGREGQSVVSVCFQRKVGVSVKKS